MRRRISLKPINTTSEGICPTLTVRYAQGFALSAAAEKSSFFTDGDAHCVGNNTRLSILEIYEENPD